MALITPKESEGAQFCAAREFTLAPMGFDDDWTEIRCGFFVSGCDANLEDVANDTDETRTVTNVSDLITVGIKNSDSLDLPGEAGSLFIGLKNASSFGSDQGKFTNPDPLVSSSRGAAGNWLGFLRVAAFNGVTEINSDILGESAIAFPLITPESGYCGFYCVRFVISDRGGASQSVAVSVDSNSKISGSDYSPPALRALINQASFGTAPSVAWTEGGVALDIPDAFYIRLPFFKNRLMLAALMAVQYQPA